MCFSFRFDDGYDLHDDYPIPKYTGDYYGEDHYNKRPLMDYTPAVKPNIVIDYGHSKKLEEAFPPSTMNKSSGNPFQILIACLLTSLIGL